jgi:DNA-binding NarL/FixJ family response regulator
LPGIAKTAKKNRMAPPIIFLTAFEDPQARSEALAAKASAFLHKPVDEQVLFAAIKLALKGLGPNTN